jgi:hypothetical protein
MNYYETIALNIVNELRTNDVATVEMEVKSGQNISAMTGALRRKAWNTLGCDLEILSLNIAPNSKYGVRFSVKPLVQKRAKNQ